MFLGGELLEQAREYIETLHGTSKGWITLADINNKKYHQWHYKVLELLEMEFDKHNMYISQNTFYKPQRRIENIKELRALFIDLDLYKLNMTKEQVIYWLNEEYFNIKIPRSNMIVDSGRGLYLIWTIESVPGQALPLWKAIEEYFYNHLKGLGADRQALDPTRILRIPTTINSKSETVVHIIEKYDYLYTLREVQEGYLPELKPQPKKKGRPKKVYSIYRDRSLYQARILDLAKICELRNYDVRGHREMILFLYRYYLCYFTEDTEKALQDTLELNSEFIYPLEKNEVIRATRSAEMVFRSKDKMYKYKNDTLIDLLEISEQEQMHLLTIISNKEYRRRNNEREKVRYAENKEHISKIKRQKYIDKLKELGKVTEKEMLSQRRAKIKDLLAEGLKQKAICEILKISKDTYIRDRKSLKDQGLI